MPARVMRFLLQNLFVYAILRDIRVIKLKKKRLLEKKTPGPCTSQRPITLCEKDSHVDHVYAFGKRHSQPSSFALVLRLRECV